MARTTKAAPAASDHQLLDVDPATLIIGANARLDPRVDKALVASIRERGVLQPITAYRNDTGDLVVVAGQRRTLAAVQAARTTVPVVVGPAPHDADRIVDQVVENVHRDGLTTAERVTAAHQLALLGVSAAQIAKRTASPRADVDASLAVAKSTTAAAALKEHDLTLDQAAALAEFEDDQAAADRLLGAASDTWLGRFDHVVQQLRNARDEAAREATAAATLMPGVAVLAQEPAWDGPARALEWLTDDAGEVLTAHGHATCPGHAGMVEEVYALDDGETEDDVTLEPGEVLLDRRVYQPHYLCRDPQAYGHTDIRPGPHRHSPSTATETARDQQTAERREVIANNKAWAAAETVRRDWLRAFLARKTAPKDTAAFLAEAIAWCDFALRHALENGNTLAHDLLGIAPVDGYDKRGTAVAEALRTAPDGRAHVVALGLILAAYEEATSRDSWRRHDLATRRYLRWIQAHGYELADVEQLACAGGADG